MAAVLEETALHLKRVIEAAVLRAHPEWAGKSVGEDIEVPHTPACASLAALAPWPTERQLDAHCIGPIYYCPP
eukprot:299114-Prymnesium_polylepis.1